MILLIRSWRWSTPVTVCGSPRRLYAHRQRDFFVSMLCGIILLLFTTAWLFIKLFSAWRATSDSFAHLHSFSLVHADTSIHVFTVHEFTKFIISRICVIMYVFCQMDDLNIVYIGRCKLQFKNTHVKWVWISWNAQWLDRNIFECIFECLSFLRHFMVFGSLNELENELIF